MYIKRTFANGFLFLRFAVNFLRKNKDLIVFPIISLVASMLIIVFCLGFGFAFIEPLKQLENVGLILGIVFLFIAYFCLAFIVLFFNASLFACTLLRLQGREASLKDGMKIAFQRKKSLFSWCTLSASVGVAIQGLENLNSMVADILSLIIGLSWGIASYFIIPILLLEDVGPFQALKLGFKVFGKGWRKTIAVNFILSLIMIAIIGLISLAVYYSPDLNVVAMEIGVVLLVLSWLSIIIIRGVFSCIVTSGLYLTIVKKQELAGLDQRLIESAFTAKKATSNIRRG